MLYGQNPVGFRKAILELVQPRLKKHNGCLAAIGIVSLVFGIFVLIFFAYCMMLGLKGSSSKKAESSVKAKAEEKIQETKEAEPETTFEDINAELPDGYVYITPQDLQRYCANLPCQKIYTVIKISDMKEGRIQSSITDGFMMSSFYTATDYMDRFKRDEIDCSLYLMDPA